MVMVMMKRAWITHLEGTTHDVDVASAVVGVVVAPLLLPHQPRLEKIMKMIMFKTKDKSKNQPRLYMIKIKTMIRREEKTSHAFTSPPSHLMELTHSWAPICWARGNLPSLMSTPTMYLVGT